MKKKEKEKRISHLVELRSNLPKTVNELYDIKTEIKNALRKIFPVTYKEKQEMLQDIEFTTLYGNNNNVLQGGRNSLISLLNTWEQELNRYGIETEPQNLNLLKSGVFWTIALSIIAGAFYLGYYFGQSLCDNIPIQNTITNVNSNTVNQ